MPRATPAQMEIRLKRVEELMAAGVPSSTLIKTIMEEFPPIGDRVVEDYVSTIYKKWAARQALPNVDEIRAQQIEMAHRRYISANAKESDKIKALNTLIQLTGTAMPTKTETKNEGKIEVVITDFRSTKK